MTDSPDTPTAPDELVQAERAQWQALVDAAPHDLLAIPVEAHIASVQHLAARLLELTCDRP